jgi:hypothetical protein
MRVGKVILNWKLIIFPITKNKSFEYQLELGRKFADQPFELSLNWSHKQDHAGIKFIFSVYKLFWISFTIYDNRHWNFTEDRWYCDGESRQTWDDLEKELSIGTVFPKDKKFEAN